MRKLSKMEGQSASSLRLLVALTLLINAQLSCADQDVNVDYGAIGAVTTSSSSSQGLHKGSDNTDKGGGSVKVQTSRPGVRSDLIDDWKENLDEQVADRNGPGGKAKNIRRVYGGKVAKLGEFKEVVFISFAHTYAEHGMTYDGSSNNCTGAIVSPKWVMTASHCLPIPYLYKYCFRKQDGRYTDVDVRIIVKAGSVDLFGASQTTAVTLSVAHPVVNNEDVVVHEDAVWFRRSDPDFPRFFYDVVLLRMSGKFPMNDAIGSVELMSGPMPAMFPALCTALGFGKQAERGNALGLPVADGTLRYNMVAVGGIDYCMTLTKTTKWSDKQFVCAYNPADQKKMTCVGDSGSPLLCGIRDHKVSVGVLSGSLLGSDCGENTPDDEYTFTGLIEEWVKNVTSNETKFSPLPVKLDAYIRSYSKSDSGQQETAPITLGLVFGSLVPILL